MLIFTEYNTLCNMNINTNNSIILNLSSFKQGIKRINISPPYACTSLDDTMFDRAYAEYLIVNDEVFFELMQIVEPYYNGKDIYILVTMGNGWDRITESLQKFLQQRYNIISYIIEDPEEINYIEELQINANGIYNFCKDRERFLSMYISIHGQKKVEDSIEGD